MNETAQLPRFHLVAVNRTTRKETRLTLVPVTEKQANTIKSKMSVHRFRSLELRRADIETVEITAPSAWASYLINADPSGLEDEEIAECDAWIEAEGLGAPVNCEDAGFIHYHGARQFALPADCATYTFIVRK
jgi:hypothetical protein